jgi:hypothetical protein
MALSRAAAGVGNPQPDKLLPCQRLYLETHSDRFGGTVNLTDNRANLTAMQLI